MKRIILALTLLLVLIAAAAGFGFQQLKQSLAVLEGELPATGIVDQIEILRDGRGVATINAASRGDIAFGLGFLHAQERFFQMDLQRRSAAGELAELFGEVALDHDKRVRVHLFRERARAQIDRLPPTQQRLLNAYAAGVNQGLSQLNTLPFEYLLLRNTPPTWQPEDSLLCLYAMYLVLQDEDGIYERSLAFMRERLPDDWFQFLKPGPAALEIDGKLVTWEAPIKGAYARELTLPTTPIQALLDDPQLESTSAPGQIVSAPTYRFAPDNIYGSNNWGVNGALTGSGAAMVANDMHLGLSVPNIWYRAAWREPSDGNLIAGATLPGTPLMVVGSNESVAWGFTNSYGDWSEVIRLELNPQQDHYLTADGWLPFAIAEQQIRVGDDVQHFEVRQTIWGPVIGEDHQGAALALRWVAHDPEGANLNLLGLERAENVAEAIQHANLAGMPAQNLMVADREGELAWTIAGPIPRRSGQPEQSLRDATQTGWHWRGYLAPPQYPTIRAHTRQSKIERLWSANSRVLNDRAYSLIGDGGYDIGVRSRTIRERLHDQQKFSELDLLTIQLDTENPVLHGWHQLLVKLLMFEPAPWATTLASNLQNWQGRAELDSVSYGLVRDFRQQVMDRALGSVFRQLEAEQYQGFKTSRVDNHLENPLWMLVTRQPEHLLHPDYASWNQLLLQSAEAVYQQRNQQFGDIDDATWGELNKLKIQHPLSRAIAILGWWLDMPSVAVPGDGRNVVRTQAPSFGASERMVVAPGQEQSGIFHMATGQSGHPLSPFYRNGHEEWLQGRPQAFLPEVPEYRLLLTPMPKTP